MAKHPKQAFGIAEDGQNLRLVHLLRDRAQVYLLGMDRIEMDRSLYHFTEEIAPPPELGKDGWDEKGDEPGEITLGEFDSGYATEFKLSPWENMLNSYDLKHGALAINVNDEKLIRSLDVVKRKVFLFGILWFNDQKRGGSTDPFYSKRAIKKFAKTHLSPDEYKAKDWQGSHVSVNEIPQFWFHRGNNRLLNLLDDHARKHKLHLFYQLADANDIALTDYFRIHDPHETKRTLLVYLGQDYRKAFLFEHGVWTNTLPLQITHKQPEPDIIYSKLALALDSAQLSDPDQIVLCGDLADKELLEYLKKQYADETVSILTFPNIVINNESAELYDAFYFSQFALPIALAYKALYPDDGRWTLSNFLPHKTIEGQKTFKIAWHGIMILIAIFAIAFLGTIAILKINQEYSQAKAKKRDQDFTIARLRIEAAEIQKIRADLELQQKNIEVMRTLLENKNPWTHLLELINRKFAQKPVSWLTNLRLESGRLGISGNTTNRDNILEFAAILPNSEISKVTQSKIKDRSVWAFEIKSDLPSVDWIAIIEKDLEELIAFKEKFGEKQNGSQSSNSDAPGAPGTAAKARAANIKSSAAYKGLNPIAEKYIPSPTEAQVKKAGAALEDYNAFIAAINRGNMWEYRDLGVKFINNHADNALIPYIRWHLAYRMYLDKELNMVRVYTEPLMKNTTDALYPYALLVSARTDFVQGSGAYVNKYNILKTDYARHPLFEQIKEDLAIVGKAVTP